MKTKFAKMLSSFVLVTALSLPCVTTYAAEAYDNEYISNADICDTSDTSVWGIEDYADNVKDVYFMCYPEMTDVIEEIVDGYLSDTEFTAAFEEMGASAFLIVEDAIHRAIEPEAAPIIYEAETYFSRHSIPLIPEISGCNDGAAVTVLMALFGCGRYDYFDYYKDLSLTESLQNNIINEITWDANDRTTIGEVTRTLRRYYNKSSVYAFQTKAATTFNDMLRMLIYSLDVDAAPVIRLPDGNGYYYAVVDSIVETDEVEDLTIIDPHTSTRRSFSFDELKTLLFPNNKGVVWMSVYNVDNSSQTIESLKSKHPSENSYFTDINGGVYDDATQCAGFARYVFHNVKGRMYTCSRSSNITGFGEQLSTEIDRDTGIFSGETLTEQTAKKYLLGVSTGAYVRVEDISKYRNPTYPYHSFAVLETSENGIKYYEANVGGYNLIRITEYTWKDFAQKYRLLFYVD